MHDKRFIWMLPGKTIQTNKIPCTQCIFIEVFLYEKYDIKSKWYGGWLE